MEQYVNDRPYAASSFLNVAIAEVFCSALAGKSKEEHLLPRIHRVVSLLKRCLLGTHQGSIGPEYLDDYLNEFTFRFNRRKWASRGKLFYRPVQQVVQVEPAPFTSLRRTTTD